MDDMQRIEADLADAQDRRKQVRATLPLDTKLECELTREIAAYNERLTQLSQLASAGAFTVPRTVVFEFLRLFLVAFLWSCVSMQRGF